MKKNKKAEMNMVGLMLVAFVAIVVGVALFQSIAAGVGTATGTATLTNQKYTAPAIGSCIDLAGQDLLSTPTVVNTTTGTAALAANYTVTERISSVDTMKRIGLCILGTDTGGVPYGAVNISYTYGGVGYVDDAGARGVANIILIFAALGIAIVALTPALRSGVVEMMGY